MRTVVGGLVGLVVAVALIAGMGAWSSSAIWPTAIAGVLAGLAMRGIASGEGSQYARGGLAGMVTAAAAVAGPLVATQIIQSDYTITSSKPAAKPTANPADEAAPAAEGDEAIVATAPETAPVSEITVDTVSVPPATTQDPFQPLPVAMLVVGCLLAYQIGKGVDPATPEEEEEGAGGEGSEPPSAEAPAVAEPDDVEEQPAGA